MLVHLLYASRLAPGVSHDVCEAILQQARQKNPGLGITGVLCQGGDVFMEVLEGGREAVNQLYHSIVRDERHTKVTLLHYQEVSERRFAGWTMGHVRLDKIMVDALKHIWETADRHQITLRTATFAVACERILSAREERGLYP